MPDIRINVFPIRFDNYFKLKMVNLFFFNLYSLLHKYKSVSLSLISQTYTMLKAMLNFSCDIMQLGCAQRIIMKCYLHCLFITRKKRGENKGTLGNELLTSCLQTNPCDALLWFIHNFCFR